MQEICYLDKLIEELAKVNLWINFFGSDRRRDNVDNIVQLFS